MKQLRRIRELTDLTILATDGEIGNVQELYFDDRTWAVRYLVVKAGGWLLSREVLLAPAAVADINDANGTMSIALTKEQMLRVGCFILLRVIFGFVKIRIHCRVRTRKIDAQFLQNFQSFSVATQREICRRPQQFSPARDLLRQLRSHPPQRCPKRIDELNGLFRLAVSL